MQLAQETTPVNQNLVTKVISKTGDITVRQVGRFFLAANPRIGALSLLLEEELLPFAMLCQSRQRLDAIESLYRSSGLDGEASHAAAAEFMLMVKQDGWFRRQYPEYDGRPLASVYFTITKRCNLLCPYCYLGHDQGNAGTLPVFRDRDRRETGEARMSGRRS